MFGFKPESACLTRTLTSLTMHARGRTIPAFAGLTLRGGFIFECSGGTPVAGRTPGRNLT
jgi:hypothetical protein